jgi:hypothetical protein
MRPLLIICSAFVSVSAYADPAAMTVPPQCAAVSAVPASAEIPEPALSAKLSLATCEAGLRFDALQLAPDEASMRALYNAAKPSLAMIDEVIHTNDPEYAPRAVQARRDLYIAMVTRMRDSIPPLAPDTVGPALARHDAAHEELERKLTIWTGETEPR